MTTSDLRANDFDAALQEAEQNPAECETSRNRTISETEAGSSNSQQVAENLEALRLRLDAKEEQLRALQRELRQRDERISQLEQLCTQNDDALRSDRLTAMGLVLESVNEPDLVHRISRITTTIGRSTGNDIVLNTNSVSRYHARIVVASDSTYLIDLQSTNGCSVNGERISRQMLANGDVIAIGDVQFKFNVGMPLSEIENRSMAETQVLLEDSVIFTPAPTSKTDAAVGQNSQGATKTK